MKSFRLAKYKKLYNKLPPEIKILTDKAYRLWKDNPYHPNLKYRQIHPVKPYYSVHIGGH